jgi:adenosylcobinamide-GDP ribazoletransferase
MKRLLLALQFLTIIPVRINKVIEQEISESAAYFPLVGLLLGLLLAGLNNLLAIYGFNAMATSAIIVVASIILTGGMHLDGLCDTFDAISSGKDKEEMLAIMKDPHIGALGAISVTCALLLKIFLLAGLDTTKRSLALILMAILSRWCIVAIMPLFSYARQEGKAKAYMLRVNKKTVLWATLLTALLASFVCPLKSFIVMAMAVIIAYLFAKLIFRNLGGITGDTLGAINEITELTVLLTA